MTDCGRWPTESERSMFTYDDVVRVTVDAKEDMRPGAKAWVIGITTPSQRQGEHFQQFPPGIVYSVEFEGGDAIDIHESMLEAATF